MQLNYLLQPTFYCSKKLALAMKIWSNGLIQTKLNSLN